ncbi:MAG: VWA domain-containing protein [Pseudomonadota bacterium]
MSIYDRLFSQKKSSIGQDFAVHSKLTAKEFGKINVRNTGKEYQIQLTILMEPQGKEGEGWQTGVALDASASMKGWFGRMLEGKVPPDVIKEYEKKKWVETRVEDGRKVKSFKKNAYADAITRGILKFTINVVEPLARDFIAYLADELDADGGTTVIYWACGDGTAVEVLGDFTGIQCRTLDIKGPQSFSFGSGTSLTPAVRYYVDRFVDAGRGMYLFITDGRIDDLDNVKNYTTQLANEIANKSRNPIKCVLIGVGDQIDERQMEELDDLDTGTDVDIWDHKIATEMRALVEIFAEVVTENQFVAPTGVIYDASGKMIKKYTDGLPAKIAFSMPSTSQWFELEVQGQRIRQIITQP